MWLIGTPPKKQMWLFAASPSLTPSEILGQGCWSASLVAVIIFYYSCYFMILKRIALCSDFYCKVISDKSRSILEQVLALRVIILILQMKRSRFREPAWFAQRHRIDVAEMTRAGTIPFTTNGDFQFIYISLDSDKFMNYSFSSKAFLFKFFI